MKADRSKKPVIALIVCLALLLVALGLMHFLGTGGRVYLPQQKTVSVPSEQGVYDAFANSGVRGRVLVIFDRTSHLDRFEGPTAQASFRAGSLAVAAPSSDLLSLLIESGLVREAYIVYPESDWAWLSKDMSLEKWSRSQGGGFETRVAGAYVKMSTKPPTLAEKPVVYVNRTFGDLYPPGMIGALEAPGASDLVVIQNPGTQ